MQNFKFNDYAINLDNLIKPIKQRKKVYKSL